MDVGLEEGDEADDGGEDDAVPEDSFENVGFFPDLMGGGGRNADALSVDHFAHDAAGAVGSANEHLQLLARQAGKHAGVIIEDFGGGDLLQTAEEGVAAGVGAGQENAEPAQNGRKERI